MRLMPTVLDSTDLEGFVFLTGKTLADAVVDMESGWETDPQR